MPFDELQFSILCQIFVVILASTIILQCIRTKLVIMAKIKSSLPTNSYGKNFDAVINLGSFFYCTKTSGD